MSHGVPSFPVLVKNYPNLKNSENVKRLIGGDVARTIGNPAYENTCTVRISRDLNYSSIHVPARHPGLATMSGGDKFNYAFRVAEMRHWLAQKFGPADIVAKGPPVDRAKFAAAKGIIAFEIHFSDGPTGHFDLWDGNTFFDEIYGISRRADHDFFTMAQRVSLWKAPGEGTLPQPPDA